MFDRLFRTIYSREIWPKMAYEEESKIYVEFSLIILAWFCQLNYFFCFTSASIDNARNSGNLNKRPFLNSTCVQSRKKQKTSGEESLVEYFEESSPARISLPKQGQVELRDFHKRSSAFGKLGAYQQTLQLGLSAVRVCFSHALPNRYSNDEVFMEKLFTVIFFKCGERRMMLEGKVHPATFYRV